MSWITPWRFFTSRFPLLFLFLLTACDSTEYIVNELDEREANEIIVFLADRGISAVKSPAAAAGGGGGGPARWNIGVPRSRKTEAMAILNSAGLPRTRGQGLLDIFKGGDLVPSDMQEKIRFQAGLGEQIASTIRKFSGVLEADVILSFPKEDPLNPNAPKGRPTAAVYVKHRGVLDDPNSYLATKIRRLVAGAVDGLSFDDVTIIADRARGGDANISRAPVNDLVTIWGVMLARESVTRFRVIFFSFFIAIWLLFLISLWMMWKLLPILHKRSGLMRFFSLQPLFTTVKKSDVQKMHLSSHTNKEGAPADKGENKEQKPTPK